MRKSRGITSVEVIVLLCIVAIAVSLCGGGCVAILGGLMPNYSTGQRVGKLYKFSQKGIFWKSWEGELILNEFALSGRGDRDGNVFAFSTLDESVAKQLEPLVGQTVTLHYRQYLIGPIKQDSDHTAIRAEAVSNDTLKGTP